MGSAYGTVNAATHKYSSDSKLVFGNSIVPTVDHLLPYYLSAVNLTQNVKQYPHVIDLYLIGSSCEKLNTTNTTDHHTEVSQPHIENITGQYLLPGTEIEYEICAVTSINRTEHEVIVEVYVLDSLSAVWDLVVNPHGKINGWRIKKEFACYKSDLNCQCWSVSYKVERAKYYSLLFTINDPSLAYSMQYNYSKSVTEVTYSLPSPDHWLHQCQLIDTDLNAQCMFLFNRSSVHFPWNMNNEVCIVAHVHSVRPDVIEQIPRSKFSEVSITYSKFSIDWLILSSAILAVLTALLLLVVIMESFACYYRYRKTHVQ